MKRTQGMIDTIIGVHFATLFSILEIIEKGEVAEAWGLRMSGGEKR